MTSHNQSLSGSHYGDPGYEVGKELDHLDSAVKCINISDVNIESKIFEILGIQLSADIIFTAYSYRGTVCRQKRDSVVFKYINISDMNIEKIFEILRNNTIYKFMLCITSIQLSAHRYLDCVMTLSLTV